MGDVHCRHYLYTHRDIGFGTMEAGSDMLLEYYRTYRPTTIDWDGTLRDPGEYYRRITNCLVEKAHQLATELGIPSNTQYSMSEGRIRLAEKRNREAYNQKNWLFRLFNPYYPSIEYVNCPGLNLEALPGVIRRVVEYIQKRNSGPYQGKN